MNLTLEQIKQLNAIQLDIFKEFIDICSKLNLTYFMIHGSLLGTVMHEGFFPFDDDIDIAMPREDYKKLEKYANELLPEHIFFQTCVTDQEYPLIFGKMRDKRTQFIQPALKNFNVEKGIYIDVFPIDYYPNNKQKQMILDFADKIYKLRIGQKIYKGTKQNIFKKTIREIMCVFCPSWKTAVKKRSLLYANFKKSDKLIIVGGKQHEKGIPCEWFETSQHLSFEDVDVLCPKLISDYLTCIYGDYQNFNPAKEYMNKDGTVTVSANSITIGGKQI